MKFRCKILLKMCYTTPYLASICLVFSEWNLAWGFIWINFLKIIIDLCNLRRVFWKANNNFIIWIMFSQNTWIIVSNLVYVIYLDYWSIKLRTFCVSMNSFTFVGWLLNLRSHREFLLLIISFSLFPSCCLDVILKISNQSWNFSLWICASIFLPRFFSGQFLLFIFLLFLFKPEWVVNLWKILSCWGSLKFIESC